MQVNYITKIEKVPQLSEEEKKQVKKSDGKVQV
ncbi:MAG: hypothetical protein JG780_1531 [Thermosipho sp. (in: Bacteria)]|jgi:hypothetical protein|nr:hypothetical protein [Thermosipho sp. (in: thermotogales)]